MADNAHTIFSLPPEIIEHILIAASASSPQNVTSLAQTCKSLHAIVYHAPDHHLWRGIFLAVFDDPRPSIRHTATLRCGARYDDPRITEIEEAYDWAGEYQRRVRAKRVLERAASLCTDVKEIPLQMRRRASVLTDEQRAQFAGPGNAGGELLDAFKALLATIETATPFPRFPSIKFEIQGLFDDEEDEVSLSRAPPFPPLLLLLCSDQFPESMQCANPDWVQKILENGFPPQLVRMLLANRELCVHGCPDFTPNLEQPAYWVGPTHDLGQAFHKLLCCTGFVPIRQPTSHAPKGLPPPKAVAEPSDPPNMSTEETHTTTESDAIQPETFASASNSASASSEEARAIPSSPPPGITMEEIGPTDDETEEAEEGGGVYGLSILRALEYSSSHSLRKGFPSAEWQFTEARSLARRRVYDMRYLHPTRVWGPYVPVKRSPKNFSDTEKAKAKEGADEERTRMESSGAQSQSSNGEYVPPQTTVEEVNEEGDEELEDDDDEDEEEDEVEDEDEDEEGGEGLHALPLAHNLRPLRPPVQPYELTPDWVWLASARIVVEANLSEMYHRSGEPDRLALGDILHALRKTQTARLGSSPGFWNAWARQNASAQEKGKGKEVAPEERYTASDSNSKGPEGGVSIPTPRLTGDPEDLEECEGWDWAGIAGVWRRCICWLDYRDLLLHNVSSQRFLDESTREACRMVPMTARITKYTRAPQPPNSMIEYPPIIHVEGESIGSDRDPRAPRRNWGKVMMLADGSIRWHMETRTPGSDEPEWSSEAIQIGGPGAASGWLGCWTGALHERPDPLGPFWAWKVG